jgi:hypothetical protein
MSTWPSLLGFSFDDNDNDGSNNNMSEDYDTDTDMVNREPDVLTGQRHEKVSEFVYLPGKGWANAKRDEQDSDNCQHTHGQNKCDDIALEVIEKIRPIIEYVMNISFLNSFLAHCLR